MQKSKQQDKRPIILTGLKACLETFKIRPKSILRTYYTQDTNIQELSRKNGSYQPNIIKLVPKAELKKISGGLTHEGIACYIESPKLLPETKIPTNIPFLLALDEISNPHNYGTIFRNCSFFNINHVLQESSPQQAQPSGAAMRVSQGGIEHTQIYETKSLAKTLLELKKKGFLIVGTSLSSRSIDYKKVQKKPLVLVLGNEEDGLRPEIAAVCDHLIIIPRLGKMESLNVSVATGILCEYFQRI